MDVRSCCGLANYNYIFLDQWLRHARWQVNWTISQNPKDLNFSLCVLQLVFDHLTTEVFFVTAPRTSLFLGWAYITSQLERKHTPNFVSWNWSRNCKYNVDRTHLVALVAWKQHKNQANAFGVFAISYTRDFNCTLSQFLNSKWKRKNQSKQAKKVLTSLKRAFDSIS